ncbi:6-carboxytetrahydropterin synthase [Aquabacter sp. CN5-332]|uniref:6-pyruvoyl trahydropterin synthase family protein n=1 Tax=Aquabacter sp. CN5-332 TaxID=3156608 RepID=UPI0032B3B361
MYAVEVRDHIMIAHSFKGALFGPAQALHGATFIVDVALFSPGLTADGVVVDMGWAHEVLKAILAPLAYRNLDELPEFAGRNTSTEVLCRHIFDRFADAVQGGNLGPDAPTRLRVTLHESHVARAWYEGDIPE